MYVITTQAMPKSVCHCTSQLYVSHVCGILGAHSWLQFHWGCRPLAAILYIYACALHNYIDLASVNKEVPSHVPCTYTHVHYTYTLVHVPHACNIIIIHVPYM